MRLCLVTIFVLLITGCGLFIAWDRAYVYEGVIKDRSNKAIAGAKLEISNWEVDIYEDGYFCFQGTLSASNLTLLVEAPGYSPLKYKFESGQLYLDIRMSEVTSGSPSTMEITPLPKNSANDLYCGPKRIARAI